MPDYLREVAFLTLALASAGCGSVTGAPSGSECFSAVDCAAGLVCIAKGSSRVCSSDLTGIETEIDAGGEGGDAAAGTGDASTGTSDAEAPMDVAVPPQGDAGAASTDGQAG